MINSDFYKPGDGANHFWGDDYKNKFTRHKSIIPEIFLSGVYFIFSCVSVVFIMISMNNIDKYESSLTKSEPATAPKLYRKINYN